MASETIQSDPGDECDATGCSCDEAPEPNEKLRQFYRDGHALRRRLSPAVQPEETRG